VFGRSSQVGEEAARRPARLADDARAATGQPGVKRAYCLFAGPEFAMIAANGGMTSATADITTAARMENRQITIQASTIRTRQTPIMTK
jgi:hypothetical protein